MSETPTNTKSGYAAIVGKPNAGKSTLMNILVGAKLSIVTPKPQTTRKRVLGIYSNDEIQIVFLDTPGVLKPRYEMQKSMMGSVENAIDEADLMIVLVDITKYTPDYPYFHQTFTDSLKTAGKPLLLLLNKIDALDDKRMVLPAIAKFSEMGIFKEIIPISAKESLNIDDLIETVKKYLPEGPFFYDPEMLSTQPQRFFASELIREKIFTSYEEEIPYSTEVHIIEFKERSAGKWYIHAEIIVEKDTQKAIIIGKNGQKLKEIGAAAREAIELHLEKEIYLELFVKVRDKWRNNRNLLKSFGYK